MRTIYVHIMFASTYGLLSPSGIELSEQLKYVYSTHNLFITILVLSDLYKKNWHVYSYIDLDGKNAGSAHTIDAPNRCSRGNCEISELVCTKEDSEFYHKTTFFFALISTCEKPNSRDLNVSETCDVRVM